MIVDDSSFQVDMLEAILFSLDVRSVTKAINGIQALKYFEEALQNGTAYSLVFLDIVMPEMDGQEALRRMRALEIETGIDKSNQATIIMTTALGSPTDMMTALLEGDCTDYIVKPVEYGNLRAMLIKYGMLE